MRWGRLRTKAVCRPLFRLGAPTLISLALFAAGASALRADDFKTPAVSAVHVEWRAVLDQLRSEISATPSVASAFTFSGQRRVPASDPRSTPALMQLNAVTSKIFTGIDRSPIPVLLPFDTAAFLDARANGVPASLSLAKYQADFRPVDLFDAGQSGYDAVFSLEPGAGDGLPQRTFIKPVEVQITGSILTYDINDPLAGRGEPVKTLQAQFPDLRRFIREGYVRYAFTRFGVPYVVSIQCLDSVPRERRLACREAYPIAERFLKALRIAGGEPSRVRADIISEITERPAQWSADFSYRPVGDLISNSGYRRQGGRVDFTAYSQIRFPLLARAGFCPFAILRQARQDRSALGRLSLARQFLRIPQLRGRPVPRRLRPPGRGHSPGAMYRKRQRRGSLRSKTPAGRRGARRRRDPLAETAGGDAADQHRQ